jgi:hypothetical protein
MMRANTILSVSMNSTRALILAGVSQLVITTAFAAPENAVIRADAAAGVAAIQACIAPLNDPFHESRAYAMMHLAIHDALNAIGRSPAWRCPCGRHTS